MIANVSWPAQVEGERASLRRFAGEVVEADWLAEAAQAIVGRADPCPLQGRLDDGDRGWWIFGDGQIVGALCGRIVELPDPPHDLALIWTWLAIDARWRAYGYGGAAVPLFEEVARSAGAQIALAPLPPDNGVALYFWLRLGYTPLRSVPVDRTDWPTGVASDALWMRRPLDSTTSINPNSYEE